MATRQISRTDLVNTTAIPFIRQLIIKWSIAGCKPNATLRPYFDDQFVGQWITPTGEDKDPGDSVVTDSVGAASGTFSVPPFTFNSGSRLLRFIDNDDIESVQFNMNSTSAENVFVSNAIRETRQTTQTTINIIENNIIGGLGDPLAQSFFTHGVKGGVSITKIDIFFVTKDTALPVMCEIREMINGYPGPKLVTRFARAYLRPEQVTLSSNALTASTFVFPAPVQLEENKDYCFVLLANSNRYNVWTSRVGEVSKETGKIVFEQPFIGSLFKSENNITWSADQFEDIKFVLWKASFDTTGSTTLTFDSESNEILLYGKNCSVVNGSSIVTMKFDHMHAVRTGDYLTLACSAATSYRGIPGTALSDNFVVTVIDDYTIQFNCETNATSSGTLDIPGIVNAIVVDSQGTNYSAPVITISAPPSPGVQALATAVVTNGKITKVNVTNPGSKYINQPTMTLVDSTGSGAVLSLISETIFVVKTNRSYNQGRLRLATYSPPFTSLETALTVTNTSYQRTTIDTVKLNTPIDLKNTSILISDKNQDVFLPNQPATSASVRLLSTNKNCSPMFSLDETPRFEGRGYRINNQTIYEDILSPNTSGSLSGLFISEPGAGYTTVTVVISEPELSIGVRATATATVIAGNVTTVTITNSGSGYLKPPSVSIVGTGSITTLAAVQASLNTFNSELLPIDGTAYSKYITKRFSLETVSNGIRFYTNAYSELESNIDVYFRMTLSSSSLVHSEQNWVRLFCNSERNRSTRLGEFLDYTFYRDNLPEFDTYDLKIVLRSSNRHKIPMIKNYRVIILS